MSGRAHPVSAGRLEAARASIARQLTPDLLAPAVSGRSPVGERVLGLVGGRHLLSARVQVTQPSEIALYLKAFEQLRDMAVYGAEARDH